MIKTYKELSQLQTFEERYLYLRVGGIIGDATFGFDRYLNQALYHSKEWKLVRNEILLRDNGCDLGVPGREIPTRPIIHHINSLTIEELETLADCIFDPNNLITVSPSTHNAIHYGDIHLLPKLPKERRKGDTSLWIAYLPQ